MLFLQAIVLSEYLDFLLALFLIYHEQVLRQIYKHECFPMDKATQEGFLLTHVI